MYGAAWCPESRKDDLAKLGFADSKQLTAETRTKLLAALKGSDYIGWIADVISPETMSAKMTRRYKYNLNAISHDSAIGMIQSALDQNVQLRHVFLDTVGDPQRYEDKLRTVFPGIGFTVSKKADSLVRARFHKLLWGIILAIHSQLLVSLAPRSFQFPVVSAASIVAKVTRDECLEQWVFREERGAAAPFTRAFGSGYPGDDRTKTWLLDHLDSVFGFPSIVRFSWSTCARLLADKACAVDWGEPEDDEDENDAGASGYAITGSGAGAAAGAKAPKQAKMSSFFSGATASGPAGACRAARAEARFAYFKNNNLHQVAATSSLF